MSSKMMVKMLKWAVTANRMIHPVHGPIKKNNNKKTLRKRFVDSHGAPRLGFLEGGLLSV